MPYFGNPHHAVYAGSFDPVTLGHVDIIQRGARLFERLTVGIGLNPDKKALFSQEERASLMREVLSEYPNVEVLSFDGLTVDFVEKCGAAVMLRGLRTLSDIEAEFTMTLANHALAPGVETVFLMASERYSHISSSLIKQIAGMARRDARDQLRGFVPGPVIAPLLEKMGPRG